MKFVFITIFLIILFLLPACENGVILSYNADKLDSVRFIKTEKLTSSNELNCEYGDSSHQHSQGDSYYVYFTLLSDNSSPVNPKNPKFANIADELEIEFQKKEANSENFIKDDSIQIGNIEYVYSGKDLTKRQNFNFLIDLSDNDCLDSNDKDLCSLSGGLSSISLGDMLNKILTSLANMYDEFNNEKATFPENDFLGIKYMAFSVKTDEDTNNWFHKMLVTYITDMDDCSGILDANNKKKIKCWLKLTDDIAYRGLKNNSSRYHRKLWDAYVAAADVVKSDASSNKNLLLFTSGYEESYYEAGSAIPGVLSEDNKSISTETDFFNAIKPEDNIPVFIAPEDRSDTDSFPTDNATDIDNKFYKLACLTNGAYFPYVNENSSWNPVKTSSYSVKGIMGNIREASYGMWRVKITLDSKTTDRFYEGGIVVKTNDITTELAGYRIVR